MLAFVLDGAGVREAADFRVLPEDLVQQRGSAAVKSSEEQEGGRGHTRDSAGAGVVLPARMVHENAWKPLQFMLILVKNIPIQEDRETLPAPLCDVWGNLVDRFARFACNPGHGDALR
jgi:hypothetical protein